MNYQSQIVSVIRQRGQLTIPDSIRENVDWISAGSVVTVAQMKPDTIVIHPYKQAKVTDWDDLWKKIELARSFKGKYKGSLSKFIQQDRESRR